MTRVLPFAMVVLAVAAHTNAADEPPRIVFRLEANRVYEAQPVPCTVSIYNVPDAPPPKFAESEDFHITLVAGPIDNSSFTSINGRMSQSSSRVYQYRLIPHKTGKLTIPGPSLTVDGKEIRAEDQTIEIIPAADQDTVFLEIRTNRQSLYPLQEFTVTLTVAVKELPEMPYPPEESDPVSLQRTPPRLMIPWVDEQQIPTGLEPVESWQEWLGPLVRKGRGFRINNVSTRPIFTKQQTSFYPEPRRVKRPNKAGIAAGYFEYEFSRKFRAVKVGRYLFGPASLAGDFAIGYDKQKDELVPEEIYATAKPVYVQVNEVPSLGRPSSYVGAVGQFQVEAELTPWRARVRDPLTLKITLRGKGAFEKATPPKLDALPDIDEEFQVYDDAQQRSGSDFTEFTYSLRPLRAGIKAFPSIPVAYFDVEQEKYVVLQTEPIPLEISAADPLRADQIVKPADEAVGLESRREGIFANVTDLSAVRDESVRPGWWFAGLAGMAGSYAALAGLAVAVRRRGENPGLLRRRGAPALARRRLRAAHAALSTGRTRQEIDLVRNAIVGLVADVADLPEAGLTGKEIQRHAVALGLEEPLLARTAALLDACDAAQFGGSQQDPAALVREAEEVLEGLIQSLKRKGRIR